MSEFGTILRPSPYEQMGIDRDDGDLRTAAPNGDYVDLHLSRFHGIVVTAARTYIPDERREVCAYLGDPQFVADWLARHGYIGASA